MKVKILLPAVFLLIILSLIITTWGYPEKARLFPLLVAFPVALFLAIDIFREMLAKAKVSSGAEDQLFPAGTLVKHLEAAAWLLTFACIIYVGGLLAGASLFLLLYLKKHGEKWLTTLIYVIAIIVLLYGVFERVFGIPLYRGILFE